LIISEKQFELPSEISNLEELRQTLIPTLEFYKNLVVTEESIKSAKSDRADLNRLKKMIDDERKKIKNRYLSPYQAIENECKQLITLIDEPVKAIDEQLKAFDEKALQTKRNVLEEHFSTENTLDFVKLEDVLPTKWKNKTEKIESLKAEISAKISAVKSDFEHIKSMYSDSVLWTAIFTKFIETRDKSATLAYAIELERSEMHLKNPVDDSVSGNVITLPEHRTAVADDSECSKTVSGAFRVTCTVEQLKNLRDFMLQHDIKFEVIKEEKHND
ncbi:MAG: DUF1351 domain-containing protein, partial [Ruminococcus sp.]|nr:DUF1351 domain-containing protein [Ruminococcus sp.]